MSFFESFKEEYERTQTVEMTFRQYLEACRNDPMMYATAAQRLLKAIGEPTFIDTRNDERLGRLFQGRKIKVYESFKDFYGMEEVVEEVVGFLTQAAQGLECSRQVMFCVGPVGSAKSSLVERLKKLGEKYPIYVLRAYNKAKGQWENSPCFESPLGVVDFTKHGDQVSEEYGIPKRYLAQIMSPWAVKRLNENDGDITKFKVVKMYPSILNQIGITKVEPGDDNGASDVSSLIGKVNIRELENFSQNDVDSYNFCGGLNVTTQGLLDMVELYKSPIKTLHPLLTATQEQHYNGTENFGALPYSGIILAHSNITEWNSFRNNKNNEAFLDRVCVIKVPYVLRTSEEAQIYQKMLTSSELSSAPCAPGTIEMLAKYSVLTRLKQPENSTLYSKMQVYNGENIKDKDPRAKSYEEYRELASQQDGAAEGTEGSSTRFAFKVLSKVFNYPGANEIAANPIHLMYVLEKAIEAEDLPAAEEERRISFIKGILAPDYAEMLTREIQQCYLESFSEYAQNIFERYVMFADHWVQDREYRDSDTGQVMDRSILNAELEKIEKSASVANPKDFRNEVVSFVLRAQANNGGKMPRWDSYNKMKKVIEHKISTSMEDLLPVISFGKKSNTEDERKHRDFVERMVSKGYTESQVRLLVEWHVRYMKHN